MTVVAAVDRRVVLVRAGAGAVVGEAAVVDVTVLGGAVVDVTVLGGAVVGVAVSSPELQAAASSGTNASIAAAVSSHLRPPGRSSP